MSGTTLTLRGSEIGLGKADDMAKQMAGGGYFISAGRSRRSKAGRTALPTMTRRITA
jgi:hypothetical protein